MLENNPKSMRLNEKKYIKIAPIVSNVKLIFLIMQYFLRKIRIQLLEKINKIITIIIVKD